MVTARLHAELRAYLRVARADADWQSAVEEWNALAAMCSDRVLVQRMADRVIALAAERVKARRIATDMGLSSYIPGTDA